MQVDDLKEKTADLVNHVEDLAETFYRLAVVNITQKASRITAGTVVALSLWVLGIFVILFSGLAFAWWMGDVVNSRAGGFLLSAALFLILLIAVLAIKKKIIFPYIRNMIIRKIYDSED